MTGPRGGDGQTGQTAVGGAPVLPAAVMSEPGLSAVLAALAPHRALIVGGAVRNLLIGAPVSDIDIATDARPEETLACAQAAGLKTVPTGLDHGTITVISGGQPFEVTSFRRDVETDGRRAVIAFSDRIEDDAARRDFTINALYAGADGVVIDPVGGLPDLAARRLRFVGDADRRIAEDYLRVLRFFRFHAWYGRPGAADPGALAACARGAAGLAQISAERVGHEMRRLLAAPDPTEALSLMAGSGVLAQVLPGADPDGVARLISVSASGPGATVADDEWLVRLAALGGADAAKRWRLSRAEAKSLSELTQTTGSLNAVAYRLGAARAGQIARLRQARDGGTAADPAQLSHAAAQVFPLSAAELMPDLSGPALGAAIKHAEAAWIASNFTLTPEALRQIARATARETRP